MRVGKHKPKAEKALKTAGDYWNQPAATAGALVGIGYALLELAYQVGRVADQVPVYGPAEEQ